ASGSVMYRDANAAGHGWFIDPTPQDDSEFAPGLVNGPAAGRVDLLTVLTHEMGHILGLDDDSATDPVTGSVMADTLPLGVRRIHLEGLVLQALSVSTPVEPVSAPVAHSEGFGGLLLRGAGDAGVAAIVTAAPASEPFSNP